MPTAGPMMQATSVRRDDNYNRDNSTKSPGTCWSGVRGRGGTKEHEDRHPRYPGICSMATSAGFPLIFIAEPGRRDFPSAVR